VVGADEVARTRVEREHTRALSTIFGEVRVERLVMYNQYYLDVLGS
jgi:hypothetical protein